MTFDEFLKTYDGKEVDTDGYYGGQCMDLMHRYIADVLGLGLSLFAAPTAYQAFQNANDSRFDKIINTPMGLPQKGDIIFWNTGIGGSGHVAIFIEGDVNNFTSFDQNFPTGSFCHKQAHNYKSVAGWLHYKTEITECLLSNTEANRQLYEQLIGKSSEYDKFTAAGYPHIDDVLKALQEKEQSIQNLAADYKKKSDEATTYLDQLTKLNDEDKKTAGELIDSQHALQPLQDEILSIKKELSIEDDSQIIPTIQTIKKSKVKAQEIPEKFVDRFVYCANLLFARG